MTRGECFGTLAYLLDMACLEAEAVGQKDKPPGSSTRHLGIDCGAKARRAARRVTFNSARQFQFEYRNPNLGW